jgi:hypothetical protein
MEKGGNAEGETPLSGGFVTEPVKVGDTVKRAIGPWSPAAHALLEHLESAGYNAAGRGSPLGLRAVVRVVPGLLAERALDAADRGADRRAPSARDGGERVEVFGPGDLLRVSEVGVAVGDVPTAVRGPERDLGLEVWNEPNEEFTTVGDEEGLLIVVKCGRPWFPTGEAARPHPVVVVARSGREASHAPPNQGYRIVECVREPERVNGAGAELPPGSAGSGPTSSGRS